ncbi:CHAT domain-containing protein [Amycolatopsis speibonae]|uniref:CHAT domain-containing protein n=1 Tax=Amycolatopsis speibonae TaxID=1450224 RepID=A0ABV7PB66_9PSEU
MPDEGIEVLVLVQAPAGLTPEGPLQRVILVPRSGNAEPIRFGFQARDAGLHRLHVTAWVGGTFLGELALEVSVERGASFVEQAPMEASLADVVARRGEVTLLVRSDGRQYVFQLLSDEYLFEPVLAQSLTAEPAVAVERAVATLKQMAQGRGPYPAGTARRWMRETGVGLWNDIVPTVIKEQFWQLRGQISSLSVATTHDVLPWELLYPLRLGDDRGFLIEQFPVLRRVFGQQRSRRASLDGCSYVLSERAPDNARQEIDAVAAILGRGPTVHALDNLLDLIDSGKCGSLHFACHNSFSLNDGGSSIAMSGGTFVPTLLNSAVVQRSLAPRNPLVFLNACRSAGAVPEYSRMMGWAQQFMAAGAGAFVGTLWPIRSETASRFAETFYQQLRAGDPLGAAAHKARLTASGQDEIDPTWLAYTVYGDPDATAQ